MLSFPLLELAELRRAKGQVALGDIVISVEKAEEQAAEHGYTLKQELELLFVHGLLHLLSFDHELGPTEARKMRRMEEKLLGKSMIG